MYICICNVYVYKMYIFIIFLHKKNSILFQAFIFLTVQLDLTFILQGHPSLLESGTEFIK